MPATILGMAVLALHLPAQSLRRLVLDEALTDSPLRVCPLTSDSTSYLVGIPADESIRPGQAYSYLQPRIDVEALAKIEHAQVPADYFRSFDATLRAARMYDGLILAYIGMLAYPDLAAEMADVLLRLEKARWVICMGVYQGALMLSVRSRSQEHTAEELVQSIVAGEGSAGGHGTMAGGQIPLGDRGAEQKVRLLRRRALQHLGIPPEGAGKLLI